MRQKPGPQARSATQVVKDIRRRTRKQHSSEEKIRIVLEGLRGEDGIEMRSVPVPLRTPFAPFRYLRTALIRSNSRRNA